MPGLFAGGTIVFIWSFTELGTPLIMNYTRCAPVQIFDALKEIGSNPFPYALVLVMLVSTVLLYAVRSCCLADESRDAEQGDDGGGREARWRRCRAGCARLPFALVTGVALLPHLACASGFARRGAGTRPCCRRRWTREHYREALGHDMTVRSIRNSLLYSSLAVAIDLVLGVAIAFVVVRSKLRVRGVLDALAMLPLAVPGLVMAFGYLAVSVTAATGRVFDSWSGRCRADESRRCFLVMAYSVRRLPYMVRSAVAGLQQTSVTFEEAAWNLGARR